MFDLFKEKIEGSLDIGTSSIKGLKLKKGKIEALDLREIKTGVVVNGNIEDYLTVNEELKTIIDNLDLKNKEIVVSIPIQNFFIKFFQISDVEEKERRALIVNELEDIVPNFDPNEFITDYVDLGPSKVVSSESESAQISVMAITIPKNRISELVEVLVTLRTKPVRIVPDFISIFNLVQMEKEFIDVEETESIMFIDVGSESTKIFFEMGGQFKFYRIVSLGGNDITSIIERFYNIDRERAEEEKKKLELLTEKDSYSDEDKEVFKEIEDLINELEDSIKISVDYYKAQENAPQIDRVFFTGGSTLLKGFKQIIEKDFDVEIENIDIARYFSHSMDEEELEEFPAQRVAALIGNVITEVSLK